MTGLHLWQKRPRLRTLPGYFVVTLVKASLALLVLEGRHVAYDWGGKTAVVLFMTITGALSGLWYAYFEQNRPAAAREKRS